MMTKSGVARSLRRIGAGATALLAALLLAAPPATGQEQPKPPMDCTSEPTFDHTTPMPPTISVTSLDDQGHVAVAAIGNDLATRVFFADHSSPPLDSWEPFTLPVSPLTCLGGQAWQWPAIVGNGLRVQVFVVGLDDRIHYRQKLLGGSWSRWMPVPTGPTPIVYVQAVMTGDRTDLFYITNGTVSPPNAVFHTSLSNGQWSSAELLGGNVLGSVSVTRGADQKFHVWAISGSNRIYVNVGNTGSWTGWRQMTSGRAASTPAATVGFEPTKQREDVFITGMDGELYQGTFTNLGNFSGWTKTHALMPDINLVASAASAGPGRLVVYALNGFRGALTMYYGGAWHGLLGAPYLDDQCVPRRPQGSDAKLFCQGLVEDPGWTPRRSGSGRMYPTDPTRLVSPRSASVY